MYDNFLEVRKAMSGEVIITRTSPYFKKKINDVLTIKNSFIGSGDWVIKKLSAMDHQRHDTIGEIMENNKRLRTTVGDREIHREMADLMLVDRVLI